MRLLRGLLKLLVFLAVLAGLVYVIVFVIGAQYTFNDVKAGSFQKGPFVRGKGDSRRFEVRVAVANRGDRKVEIRKVGGIEGNALARVKVRMARREMRKPARRLVPFKAFELKPGRQREVGLLARFKCSELGKSESILIDAVEVRYKVGLFEKNKNIALKRRVRVGRKGARC